MDGAGDHHVNWKKRQAQKANYHLYFFIQHLGVEKDLKPKADISEKDICTDWSASVGGRIE